MRRSLPSTRLRRLGPLVALALLVAAASLGLAHADPAPQAVSQAAIVK
jgi:hypothetical protein